MACSFPGGALQKGTYLGFPPFSDQQFAPESPAFALSSCHNSTHFFHRWARSLFFFVINRRGLPSSRITHTSPVLGLFFFFFFFAFFPPFTGIGELYDFRFISNLPRVTLFFSFLSVFLLQQSTSFFFPCSSIVRNRKACPEVTAFNFFFNRSLFFSPSFFFFFDVGIWTDVFSGINRFFSHPFFAAHVFLLGKPRGVPSAPSRDVLPGGTRSPPPSPGVPPLSLVIEVVRDVSPAATNLPWTSIPLYPGADSLLFPFVSYEV